MNEKPSSLLYDSAAVVKCPISLHPCSLPTLNEYEVAGLSLLAKALWLVYERLLLASIPSTLFLAIT